MGEVYGRYTESEEQRDISTGVRETDVLPQDDLVKLQLKGFAEFHLAKWTQFSLLLIAILLLLLATLPPLLLHIHANGHCSDHTGDSRHNKKDRN